MANSYTQIHVQFVFAVKYRAALIHTDWKERLHQYITGIFQENNHKMLQINSVADHIHIFAGIRPHQSISSLMKNVKTESSKWVKAQGFCSQPFAWQEGYGAFSYSKSQVPDVVRYVMNQEAHHKKVTFLDEYRKLLTLFEIDWDWNNAHQAFLTERFIITIMFLPTSCSAGTKLQIVHQNDHWPK